MVITEDTQQQNSSSSMTRDRSELGEKVAREGLEAILLRDRESTLRWVDDAPLRLVAAALVDSDRRTAKVADIKTALTPDVIKSKDWNRWWNIVRFGLKKSRHFSYAPREPIRLRTPNPAEVDSESLDDLRTDARKAQSRPGAGRESTVPPPSLAGLGGWIIWVQADEEEPMPRSVPSPEFIRFLRKLPESVTSKAISRLSAGTEQRILASKQRPAEKSVEMWQECLASALTRWSELSSPPSISVESIVSLTVRVLETLGQAEFEDVVAWLAAYISKSGDNVETVSSALLNVSQEAPNGTELLLAKMSSLLNAPVRTALWKRLLSTGMMRSNKPPMGRWMRVVGFEDKPEIFSNLLVMVREESSIMETVALLEAEWRIADEKQRPQLFDAVALAWVLHQRSMPDVKMTMLEVAGDTNGQCGDEGSLLSGWMGMVRSASENEVRRVREDSDRRIGGLERQLKETEAELDRIKKQARFLQGENRRKRSTAELEISRDAITVLGTTLQGLAISSAPKSQEITDVEAGITLALSALGARLVGEVGEVVTFDPMLHEASPPLAPGAQVKVTAPGLRYSRRSDDPVNLMKIQVQKEGRP